MFINCSKFLNKIKEIVTFRQLFFLFYVLIFIAGCYFRFKLYLLNNDMHYDEIALAMQVIERSYIELFKPLDLVQVCPPVFLVIAKFLYNIFYNLYPAINFRDLIFRLLPLCSGIISIPLFAYILNKLFKNPLINLSGMLLLAINPAHIVWSTIFKQYSFELLVSLLIILLFLNIELDYKNLKKNICIFVFLGLILFCSLTAIYILPCGFVYLLCNLKNKNQIKSFLSCFGIFLSIFVLYILSSLLPVYIDHYSTMNSFWFQEADNSVDNIYNFITLSIHILFRTANFEILISILFIAGLILMLIKNFKHFILTILPVFVTYLFICSNHYPLAEKFLIFAIPFFIVPIIYPFIFIDTKYKFYNLIVSIAFIPLFIFSVMKVQDISFINSGLLNTKTILKHLSSQDKKDGKIIFYPDTNQLYIANIYYNSLPLSQRYNPELLSRKVDVVENLPKGVYYIICANYTVKEGYKKTMEFLDKFLPDCEILEFKNFDGKEIYSHRPNKIGKFAKLTEDAIYIKVNKIR